MAKNKKDIVADLLANIFDNTVKGITPTKAKIPHSDLINAVALNITIANFRAEDDSAEHTAVHIVDPGKQGVFYYDSTDITTADDGVTCLLNATGKRYKRAIGRKFDNRWMGSPNSYFTTLAAANAAIPASVRFIGLEVDLLLAGTALATYWYRDGTGDVNLVAKNTNINTIDFTIGDGQTYTPADGATFLVNPAITNASIIYFTYGNVKVKLTVYPATLGIDTLYGQFDAANAKIYLQNGTFSTGTDGLIIYK